MAPATTNLRLCNSLRMTNAGVAPVFYYGRRIREWAAINSIPPLGVCRLIMMHSPLGFCLLCMLLVCFLC
jgi:hypothetical protein